MRLIMPIMFEQITNATSQLMDQGGWVMWPLIALSVVGLTLIFERCWFWLMTNNPWRLSRYRRVGHHLRRDELAEARALVEGDTSVYGRLVQRLLEEGTSDAAITDAAESQRPRMERFMPTLGTIITAAPLLGILGTVMGIISSFRILGAGEALTDPNKIGAGIAEALLTTAVGLVIALVVLFPYNAYRAQIDRTLGRMESLAAAARRKSNDAG
jgi:biopolymer transport protein ExbB